MNKNIHLLKNLYKEDRICAKKAGPGMSRSAFCAFLVVFGTAQMPYLFVLCVGAPCFLFALRLMASKVSPCAGFAVSTMLRVFFMCLSLVRWDFLVLVILDPLDTAGAARKEKFSRGSAKANEFEIGIQHMGTTQRVLWTDKFISSGQKNVWFFPWPRHWSCGYILGNE